MAATVAINQQAVPGNTRYCIADITFDSSYPTGGYAITAAQLGLSTAIYFVVANDAAGYNTRWDNTNGKLMVYDSASLTVAAALSPALVAANTTAEQTLAFAGLNSGDILSGVSKPTAQAGLGIVGYRVPSAGNIAITFSNNTASGITPTASETYTATVVRAGGTALAEVANATSLSGVSTRIFAYGV